MYTCSWSNHNTHSTFVSSNFMALYKCC